jgi:predicted HTH domain antitoxin
MYAACRVTLGRAAEIAGIPQMQFQRELATRRVPLHYDHADLSRAGVNSVNCKLA